MVTVTMPQLGESVTEGTILHWLKRPGEPVALDDPLCEIETEKVTAELPSPYEGTMGRVLVPEGETIEVGAALCEIVEGTVAPQPAKPVAAGAWAGGPMAIPPDEPVSAPAVAVTPPAAAAVHRTPRGPELRERFYSPVVMRLAAEHGIDLATLHGSGVGGRVTRKDVEAAAAGTPIAAPPAPPPPRTTGWGSPVFDVVKLSPTRRTIAENLKRSNLEAPQAWTMVEVDVTGLVALRERDKEVFEREEGIHLTLLPYFTAAVCEGLRRFPALNARWEGDELRHFHRIDIGVAIATEQGLLVPVVHNAGDLSVAGLARAIADLTDRARARRLRVEDVEGGTFTVDNTGAFGSIASKPLVNYPQVAIVTMERAVRRPAVAADGSIAARWMMNVCLSFDHRAMDGVEAGGFLADLKQRLEATA